MGGGEKKHLHYARALRDRGHDVFMIVQKGSALDIAAAKEDLKTYHVTAGNLSILNPFKRNKLRQIFRGEVCDAVLFNGPRDLKLGAPVAHRAGVKSVIYWRGIAVPPNNSMINRGLFTKFVDVVITNSQQTKMLMQKALPEQLPDSKFRVIYNGIDMDATEETGREAPGVPLIIGNAARLTAQKGQTHLITLAQQLKEEKIQFQIRIAGEGEERNMLEAEIRKSGMQDSIRLEGFVSDMQKFYREIDILAFPSEWEGFGFSMVEAMAAGVPVVAFDVSSNPEIIRDGYGGDLVPFRDMTAFSERILHLAKDPALYQKMSKQAIQHARAHFQLSDKISAMEECLKSRL